MSKNLPITVKRRPFKIWVKNQRRLVDFTLSHKFIPSRLLPSTLLGFNASASNSLRFRRVIVKSTSYGYISASAIEAFRKVIAPHFRKKKSKIYKFLIRCYPYMPLTKKPAEVRMGGGKGSKVRGFYSPVRPGQILFEVFVREPQTTKKLFIYAARKLPVPVTIMTI
jgi:large subunit ribosomal protein L16